MIRRDVTAEDGSPAWVLIAQMEHARVAGELAKGWGAAPYGQIGSRDVVLPTIYRHDDGWAHWERQPAIDPATGRPQSFTEMPAGVAHAIWRRSIESVVDLGPLAQYMVAQHFMRLRRGGDETREAGVQAFLDEFDARCRTWLAAWQAEDAGRHSLGAAERAVDFLQLFDAFSLTLCCADCVGPQQLRSPTGIDIELSPWDGQIAVSPWPWSEQRLEITAAGRILPAAPLASDEQFRERLSAAQEVELAWRLTPRGPSPH